MTRTMGQLCSDKILFQKGYRAAALVSKHDQRCMLEISTEVVYTQQGKRVTAQSWRLSMAEQHWRKVGGGTWLMVSATKQ